MSPPTSTFARGHNVGFWGVLRLHRDADDSCRTQVVHGGLDRLVLVTMLYIELLCIGCYVRI